MTGDPERRPDRELAADKLEKYGRRAILALVPLAVVAVVDFATGSLGGDRRGDVALLIVVALGLWAAYNTRRLARRFRSGALPERAKPAAWTRAAASVLVSLAFCVGVGYLLGGWTGAVLLSAVTTVLIGTAMGVGLRRRRRMGAGRTTMR